MLSHAKRARCQPPMPPCSPASSCAPRNPRHARRADARLRVAAGCSGAPL